jgi:hypothetical protein
VREAGPAQSCHRSGLDRSRRTARRHRDGLPGLQDDPGPQRGQGPLGVPLGHVGTSRRRHPGPAAPGAVWVCPSTATAAAGNPVAAEWVCPSWAKQHLAWLPTLPRHPRHQRWRPGAPPRSECHPNGPGSRVTYRARLSPRRPGLATRWRPPPPELGQHHAVRSDRERQLVPPPQGPAPPWLPPLPRTA